MKFDNTELGSLSSSAPGLVFTALAPAFLLPLLLYFKRIIFFVNVALELGVGIVKVHVAIDNSACLPLIFAPGRWLDVVLVAAAVGSD
jgi:hypothetical protein